MVKKVIEMHKGKIWIESQPDEGTTFHFTLPLPREMDPSSRETDVPAHEPQQVGTEALVQQT